MCNGWHCGNGNGGKVLKNNVCFIFVWSQGKARIDSNIEWKSSNNTYLNIIKIFNKLLK